MIYRVAVSFNKTLWQKASLSDIPSDKLRETPTNVPQMSLALLGVPFNIQLAQFSFVQSASIYEMCDRNCLPTGLILIIIDDQLGITRL